MEVLIQFGEQRREVRLATGCDVLKTLETEFKKLSLSLEEVAPVVPGAHPVYTLQRFSSKWQTFVDVTDPSQVFDGDKLTVLEKKAKKVTLKKVCQWPCSL